MQRILLALIVGILATPAPAEARRDDRAGIYQNTYPSCTSQGCVRRHESAIRNGHGDRHHRRSAHRARSRSRY